MCDEHEGIAWKIREICKIIVIIIFSIIIFQ